MSSRRGAQRVAFVVGALMAAWISAGSATAVAIRTPIWSSTFRPFSGASASAIAVSPTSNTVYVGGRITSSPERFAIVAYATGTGQRRWLTRYPSGGAPATACWMSTLAVTPDASTLFSSGATFSNDGSGDWVTTAIDAATGATIWVARIQHATVWTPSLVMAPAGGRIFVAGPVGANGRATRVVAYRAVTGEELWRVRVEGGASDRAVGVSPGGNRLYVGVVRRQAGVPLNHIAVVALAARTGSVVWDRSYGNGNRMYEDPADLAVDPLGERVYVTVVREAARGPFAPPLTLAFGATHGTLRWMATEPDIVFSSYSVEVVASARRVFVGAGYGVVSRAARTGRRLWGTSTDPLGQDWWAYAAGLALSPDGLSVFVNESFENTGGTAARLVTMEMNGTTGDVDWYAIRRITHGGGKIVVGPHGGRVFVAGSLFGGSDTTPDQGFVTMAYRS